MPLPGRDYFLRHRVRRALVTEDNDECPICQRHYNTVEQENETAELPVRLPCDHILGEQCVRTHFYGNTVMRNTCPICRAVLFTDEDEDDEDDTDSDDAPVSWDYDYIMEMSERTWSSSARVRIEHTAVWDAIAGTRAEMAQRFPGIRSVEADVAIYAIEAELERLRGAIFQADRLRDALTAAAHRAIDEERREQMGGTVPAWRLRIANPQPGDPTNDVLHVYELPPQRLSPLPTGLYEYLRVVVRFAVSWAVENYRA